MISTCLVSLPWDYYQTPSIAIGTVAAHARQRGCAVEARHLHLEAAALWGFTNYDLIAYKHPVAGEALHAAWLMPENADALMALAGRKFADPEGLSRLARDVLRIVYESYDWSAYALIGFSVHFAQVFSSLLMAQWIKQDHPGTRVLLGGGCITTELGRVLLRRFHQVDWCLQGEGEQALVQLVEALEKGGGGAWEQAPGLMYRVAGGVQVNPKSHLASLAGMPDPDYDHYFQVKDCNPLLQSAQISTYLPVEVGRGCVHHCAFCNFSDGIDFRRRPSSEVADSMLRLSRRHRVGSFCLLALMIPFGQCQELFGRLAAHRADYRIFCEARAGMRKEDLAVMKRAGVTEVQIGIEALDSQLLQRMNKGTRLIDNLEIMKFCEELGIKTNSFLMLGFPTEAQEDVDRSRKAIALAMAYHPPSQVSPYSLRGGSPVDRRPAEFALDGVESKSLFNEALFDLSQGRVCFAQEPPEGLRGIPGWFKDYRTSRPPRAYDGLLEQIRRWEKLYWEAKAKGRPPLCYIDGGEHLLIEDHRAPAKAVTRLSGLERELYLYCDSTRSQEAIRRHFAGAAEQDVRAALDRLVGLGVMHQEQDHYLGLAIHVGPLQRRHLPFPWR